MGSREKILVLLLIIMFFALGGLIFQTQKQANIDFDKFEMNIKSFDDITMVLEVKNNTNADWLGGESYNVERYIGGSWQSINDGVAFISIGYPIGKNQTKEFTINLKDLTSGKYRISKNFGLYEEEQMTYLSKELDVRIIRYCYFKINK